MRTDDEIRARALAMLPITPEEGARLGVLARESGQRYEEELRNRRDDIQAQLESALSQADKKWEAKPGPSN